MHRARSCQTQPVPERRLLLIRHTQAGEAPTDVDRPLTEKGARAAAAIGSWLQQTGVLPDQVILSPARRAVETWDWALAALPPGLQPVVDERIYTNTVEAVLEAIRESPHEVRTLVVVGHNPSIGELATLLDDGAGDSAARSTLDSGFRTGGVAVFELDEPFAAIAPGEARLTMFAVPGD